MRLWQKIFLLTLCLTALAANSISLALLTRNQSDSLVLAKERIGTVCDGAVRELGHLIQEEKEAKGCLMLTEAEMRVMLSKIRLDENGQLFFIGSGEDRSFQGAMQEGEGIVISALAGRLLPKAEGTRTELVEKEGKIQIRRATTVFWEGRFYRVEVYSDLSELFGWFREDLVFCQWMSGTVSLLTAVILLCSILYLTRPLKRLEVATEHIAGGEYGYRIHVKGNDEIAELSRHMNEMASEVETSIRRVEELARERETFIANMAHELKTPLASMKVLADSLLVQEEVPVELYQEFLEDIVSEIDRENRIITDLLTLVKMDKKVSGLNIAAVNINDLTELILKRLRPIARKKDVEVVFESVRPVTAEVDEVKMTLVMSNLVENAIKYNKEHGWVKVVLDADHQYFTFEVSDSGMGIPEDCLTQIYERFYRVEKSHSREIGGTGLGLVITKNAVLMHRGSITVTSTEGEGSTFLVKIPLNYIAQ